MLSVNCKQQQQHQQQHNKDNNNNNSNSKLLKVKPRQNSPSQNPSRLHNKLNPDKKKLQLQPLNLPSQ